jgi:hypothetical protein
MTVEIDRNSGFCGGVISAIEGAEKLLAENGCLYSLGAIVHNEAELARLHAKGLVTLTSLGAAPASFPSSPKKGSAGKASVSHRNAPAHCARCPKKTDTGYVFGLFRAWCPLFRDTGYTWQECWFHY